MTATLMTSYTHSDDVSGSGISDPGYSGNDTFVTGDRYVTNVYIVL